jgi:hypothetical protein
MSIISEMQFKNNEDIDKYAKLVIENINKNHVYEQRTISEINELTILFLELKRIELEGDMNNYDKILSVFVIFLNDHDFDVNGNFLNHNFCNLFFTKLSYDFVYVEILNSKCENKKIFLKNLLTNMIDM